MLLSFPCPACVFYVIAFQWAPTLGGECYEDRHIILPLLHLEGFNGHPPLGVNATEPAVDYELEPFLRAPFQWAPTLGGECYDWWERFIYEMGLRGVSMGTHPWG